MPIVYLGIGSNLGDRRSNCHNAINRLQSLGVRILRESSVIESEPWGVEEQPLFMNMAVEAETALAPDELLRQLKIIEKEMGRVDTFRWGPRIIDIDILFYDDLVMDTEALEIPHKHLHERRFVLAPLAEIAPDKKHPLMGKTVGELLVML